MRWQHSACNTFVCNLSASATLFLQSNFWIALHVIWSTVVFAGYVFPHISRQNMPVFISGTKDILTCQHLCRTSSVAVIWWPHEQVLQPGNPDMGLWGRKKKILFWSSWKWLILPLQRGQSIVISIVLFSIAVSIPLFYKAVLSIIVEQRALCVCLYFIRLFCLPCIKAQCQGCWCCSVVTLT